jgi:hypothetical protein
VTAPKITGHRWGELVVGATRFRDAKLAPDGAVEWDWRASDTHHVPGIQIADVEYLLERGSQLVILSRGFELVLQVPPETIAWMEPRVRFEILESGLAIARYNELAEAGEPVGALIHSTC